MKLALVLLLLLTSCSHKQSSIATIHKFAEIPNHLITPETLILVDIDNTILRAESHYGSVEHFEHFEQELSKKNLTDHRIKLEIIRKWEEAQKRIEQVKIDDAIHQFISKAFINKATILAFTARERSIESLTYNSLAKHNIFMTQLPEFSFNHTFEHDLILDHNGKKQKHFSTSTFYKGIIFASFLNHKGIVFQKFFAEYKSYAQKHKMPVPSKIILVDDKMYNLDSVNQAIKGYNLDFYGFHILSQFNFDPEKAKQEEISLSKTSR